MEKKETLEIWLGRGDKIVACAHNEDEGWAGVCISTPGDKQPIETIPDSFGPTTDDVVCEIQGVALRHFHSTGHRNGYRYGQEMRFNAFVRANS